MSFKFSSLCHILIIVLTVNLCLMSMFELTAQTRIAILGDIEKNRAEIDCLTERLTKDSNIALVERSEIDKIIAEQKLSMLSEDSAIKIGAMLGAKGVIVIKSFEWEGKNVLSARLVASESGAIIGFWIQDTPSTEAFHFADAVKFEFTPLFNKLDLNRKDMMALSILDIRAAVDSPESKELERKITLLLSQRLMLEKSFVVLERWRLSNIAWEKELNVDQNKFWTGSSVLDGSLESLLDGKGTVKAILRLRDPGKKEPVLIEVSGSTLDLKGFVEKMVPLLKAKLGADTSNPSVSWNMDKEADFYFNEAQWLLRAGSFERAREAADAASTLGKTGPEINFILIMSYLGELGYSRKEVNHNEKLKHNAKSSTIALMENFDKLAQMLDIYIKFVEAGPRSLPGTFDDEKDWRKLGCDLLRASSELLQKIEINDLAHNPKLQEKIKLARLLIRKAVSLTMDKGDDAWTMRHFYSAYVPVINLIFDKPEEVVAEYKRLLTRKFPLQPEMHCNILFEIMAKMNRQSMNVLNIDTMKNRNMYPDGFLKTIQELENSGKSGDKVDALILAGPRGSSEKISALLWEYRDQLFDGNDSIGDCPKILIFSDKCPRETMVKLFLYEFSKDYVSEGDEIGLFLNLFKNRYHVSEDSHKDNRKLAEAWYSYYDRIKNLHGKGKADSIKSIEIYIASMSSFRPENEIKTECPVLSPSFSFSMRELLPNGSRPELEYSSFKNGYFQVLGYFKNQAFIVYCNDKIDAKPSFISASSPSTFKPFRVLPKMNAGLMLKAGDNVYYASHEGEIQKAPKGSGNWIKLKDTGFKAATAIAFSNDMLYVGYGHEYNRSDSNVNIVPSAIVQIDTENGDMTILASSRRNPPLSPLDNCPPWYPAALACSDNGILVARVLTGNKPYYSSGYELDIANNKWKCSYKKEIASFYADYGYGGSILFERAYTESVFNVKNGMLKSINSMPIVEAMYNDEPDPAYNDSRFSVIRTGNDEKIFTIKQLDADLFDINALDVTDEKLSGLKFRVDQKSISPDCKFLRGFAVSEKFAYIVLGSSKFNNVSDFCVFAFDLNSILKPLQREKPKYAAQYILKPFEALPSLPASLKPGLLCNFYKGAWDKKVPNTLLMTPTSIQTVNNMKVPNLEWDESAVFSFRGYFKAEKEGKYSFYINERSASAIHINEIPPKLGPKAYGLKSYGIGSAILKAGFHSIRADIWTDVHNEKIEVTVKVPGEEKYKSVDGLVFYSHNEK